MKAGFGRLFRGDRPIFALLMSIATQVGVTGINIVTGVVTARFLGPQGRGVYSALTTWPQLLSFLALSGIGNALIFHLRRTPEQAPRIAAAGIAAISGLATIAIMIGLAALPSLLRQYDNKTIIFAQILLLGTYTNSIQILFKQIFAGKGTFGLFNISNILPPLLYLFGLIPVMLLRKISPDLTALILVIAALIALIAVTPAFLNIARPNFRGCVLELRRITSYSLRAWPMDVVSALANFIDRLILIPMVSPADLGFYVVAYSASRLVQIAQPAINSIIFSNMSLRNKEEAKVLHDYAFRFSLLILAPGTILFIILSKFLLTLVYGRDFGAAAALFDVLVLEATLSCLAQITLQLFLALDRPGFASTVQTSSFLISGVCIAVLVPLYGSMGAAVGILVAAICRMGLLFVGLDRSLGLQFPRLWLNAEDINYIRARLLESRAI